MYYFENIIDEIEENITDKIDVNKLAQKANMSVYEFRRIFTFVTKISFGEYIRKRRLSLAALDFYEGEKSVSSISEKYGYDSSSSFSRAFKEFHGISPSDVINGNNKFKLLTRINTEIITTGGLNISYAVFKKPEFRVSGFYDKSTINDTECCENVWNSFYSCELGRRILEETDKIYAVYDNGDDFVKCYIGAEGYDYSDGIYVPESEWVCFKLIGIDDDYVNGFYNDILKQWFSSSGYIKNSSAPNIEVFPSDMNRDDFEWEIWIPIRKAD